MRSSVKPVIGDASASDQRRVERSVTQIAVRGESTEPEILIDPREAAALRALIYGARDGRIDLVPVLNASQPAVMELPPVVDIHIPEITIDPIAPGAGEQGVRQ